METIKRQPSPASHQVRHKDLDLGGSRVACPELKETPTSAIGLTGKVEKVEEEVRKVEAPPPGKRPTLQNADDGRTAPPAAPTKAAREKITAEEAEKQKLSRSQNNGRQDLGKSENIRQGSSSHNGIAKTPTEKPKLEPAKPTPQIPATEKPDVKTAPWRQGRSGQGEAKEKIVKGSKRQEQEAKVQEFLRDPNAPPGSSSVPLEVRLRKPGRQQFMMCGKKYVIET